MKKAVIVHCWDGYPEYCWYPQTKKDLERMGFEVDVPAMPETGEPKLAKWLPVLQETVGEPSEDIFLIGHSVGCITILRYLEQLPEDKKVGGVVLVAGFADDLGFDELKNFFETPLNFDDIKTKAPHFIAIHSDNDPYVELKHAETFKNKLKAEVVVKQNMGHFSGEADDEESCLALPAVVRAVTRMQ